MTKNSDITCLSDAIYIAGQREGLKGSKSVAAGLLNLLRGLISKMSVDEIKSVFGPHDKWEDSEIGFILERLYENGHGDDRERSMAASVAHQWLRTGTQVVLDLGSDASDATIVEAAARARHAELEVVELKNRIDKLDEQRLLYLQRISQAIGLDPNGIQWHSPNEVVETIIKEIGTVVGAEIDK